ncbi:SafA/ExsA family spore coat assembly protein [Caldibacillus lycopersici]|uniref:SafA/ExsA family spore coat assembly protein n=1 Tax=Perspicuibacillus lycopersici TaxID=1325689 RepID=A0AAE3IV26_9BACI|nr:SafA/ExsA family spore coat assembly protein [Perspicuibacillus lycopersici]MCU9615061.1 SafA/ExsA family spore coat assembly protein [Perspicuibacillus lycopersici]
MKKLLILLSVFVMIFPSFAFGQNTTYTVQPGDSMWKIAVRFQVGLSELIQANPQIKNPALIYPNQKLTIPAISEKNFEAQVVTLVNQERAKAGLTALTHNWELSRVARYKSMDMRDRGYFSHTSPTYGSPFDMMKNFGINYRTAGENIAQGQTTPAAVVQAWMNSPGHRANILSTQFTEIGVGYAAGGSGRHYWTEMFIDK